MSITLDFLSAYLKKVLWREEMKMMFVCLNTVLGREQVVFDLPFLGQEVTGCKVRKYSGTGSIFDLSFTYNLSHFFRVL